MIGSAARWMVVGGAVGMLASFALGWSSYGGETGDNPFHYPFTGGVAWLLVVAAGVMTIALARRRDTTPRQQYVGLAMTGLGAALMLLRIVLGGREVGPPADAITVDRGAGMWIALVAALVALAGATVISTRPSSLDTPRPAP